jgi:pimeloyl-ACP methyl ester carboxylesterase
MTAPLVVMVHGVWMPGGEMMFVKLHLESEHGFKGMLFSYPSVRGTLDENALLLADFINFLELDEVYIVGHSLGGVVALRMLALYPDVPPGRVVCLGSPLCGSRAAELLNEHDWGNAILGKSVVDGVVAEAANEWGMKVTATREIGSIAGTVPMGIGRLLAQVKAPSDGTVTVAETMLPGLKDHMTIDVSHSGLVLSKRVIDQAAAFLKNGEFVRND